MLLIAVFLNHQTQNSEKSKLTPPLGLHDLPLFEDSKLTWMWLITLRCLTPLLGVNLNPISVCL